MVLTKDRNGDFIPTDESPTGELSLQQVSYLPNR